MKGLSAILFVIISFSVSAQTDSTKKKVSDYFTLRGYVKEMVIVGIGSDLKNVNLDNLIHNRLNFRGFPHKNLTLGLEVRNRIFIGESVEANPKNYGDQLRVNNDLINMNWLLVNEPAFVFLTQIDRAWVDYSYKNWEVRVGRQRINWGTNLFWNSNDLFNAYSLVDFDYEERPGTDAVRVQKHFKNMQTLDIAIKPGKDSSNWIGAAKFSFNKWQYDFQVLAGWWNRDIAIGIGWAGNISTAGFKGEATYFHPVDESDSLGTLSLSVSTDIIFKNQMYLTIGAMYNSSGIDKKLSFPQELFSTQLTAKNLMPTKYNLLLSWNYPVSPILSMSFVSTYSPVVNSLLLMPSVALSISNSWEAALFAQSFWVELDNFTAMGNGLFIRFKGSF